MKRITLTLIASLVMFLCQAQTVSKRDKEFAECAAKAGIMEVKLGELAQTNGSSAEVKNLGQHMIDDHTKANNELKSLAEKKGITLPQRIDDKQLKSYQKLEKKKGKDFDKAYTKCMVKDHKKVICKFKKEAKKGDDAELKNWASATIPKLEHHKQMSKDACKAVKNEK